MSIASYTIRQKAIASAIFSVMPSTSGMTSPLHVMQRTAIGQEQDDNAQRRAGDEELLAGEREARVAQQQLQQGEEQEGDHGAEDQPQDAVLLMDKNRAHRPRPFDQGEALLGHITPLGPRQ